MLTAEAHILTARPGRYLVQLCRHANSMDHRILRFHAGRAQSRPEMRQVEWSDTDGTVALSWGRCTMHAGADTLTVHVEAASEEDLQQIQDLIARNLERFGRRDHLKVNWHRPEAPTVPADETG